MNDFLQDDFFYAKPILNIEGLGKEDVITDLLSIEEFHGRDLFLDNPISSEFVISDISLLKEKSLIVEMFPLGNSYDDLQDRVKNLNKTVYYRFWN